MNYNNSYNNNGSNIYSKRGGATLSRSNLYPKRSQYGSNQISSSYRGRRAPGYTSSSSYYPQRTNAYPQSSYKESNYYEEYYKEEGEDYYKESHYPSSHQHHHVSQYQQQPYAKQYHHYEDGDQEQQKYTYESSSYPRTTDNKDYNKSQYPSRIPRSNNKYPSRGIQSRRTDYYREDYDNEYYEYYQNYYNEQHQDSRRAGERGAEENQEGVPKEGDELLYRYQPKKLKEDIETNNQEQNLQPDFDNKTSSETQNNEQQDCETQQMPACAHRKVFLTQEQQQPSEFIERKQSSSSWESIGEETHSDHKSLQQDSQEVQDHRKSTTLKISAQQYQPPQDQLLAPQGSGGIYQQKQGKSHISYEDQIAKAKIDVKPHNQTDLPPLKTSQRNKSIDDEFADALIFNLPEPEFKQLDTFTATPAVPVLTSTSSITHETNNLIKKGQVANSNNHQLMVQQHHHPQQQLPQTSHRVVVVHQNQPAGQVTTELEDKDWQIKQQWQMMRMARQVSEPTQNYTKQIGPQNNLSQVYQFNQTPQQQHEDYFIQSPLIGQHSEMLYQQQAEQHHFLLNRNDHFLRDAKQQIYMNIKKEKILQHHYSPIPQQQQAQLFLPQHQLQHSYSMSPYQQHQEVFEQQFTTNNSQGLNSNAQEFIPSYKLQQRYQYQNNVEQEQQQYPPQPPDQYYPNDQFFHPVMYQQYMGSPGQQMMNGYQQQYIQQEQYIIEEGEQRVAIQRQKNQ